MICFPNAKINIGLNITSRRSDGYHNVETVFYPVKINDALEIIEAPQMGFETSGIAIPGLAQDNLCIKAYNLLRQDFNLPNIHIHLHKIIPIGAGLGGGSADAAFFIKLVNDKFELGLTDEAMQSYCQLLGADCAFFIQNKPLFACGKGDVFKPIALDLSDYMIVLVMPPVHVSTAEAYRGVQPKFPHQNLQPLIKLPINQWQGKIVNDFEPHIFKAHPQIREVKTKLIEAGAIFALMSGSGASVFGIFDSTPDVSFFKQMGCIVFDNL
ncbi:MAG: 4-(cytidine 5'-diphospho)-2-C-methyl-D-erythritol kinase [Sphingobacteriales bacterium]|nr:MAG: 4-(cytidine 5'-diphospho)-2-C-methyl-D-erythritol kinase [Sphingobacteriales bacterium]TAF81158.1 MAG: 4-(cytidine 5'-diphospho)-2-C-methyl-D-erythritol kinase [Sphingobacteriales bacterium]